MVITWRIGTLDFAQLAFVTKVNNVIFLGRREIADVVALRVDRLK
jgi:hypothetical protein